MAYNIFTNKYLNNQHQTRKSRQIILLYEGAIKSIHLAIHAIESNNIQTKYNEINRVINIISGMQASLDFNINNGQIAKVLYDYYEYIQHKLHISQLNNCDKSLKQVQAQLESMLDAWRVVDFESVNNELVIDTNNINNNFII